MRALLWTFIGLLACFAAPENDRSVNRLRSSPIQPIVLPVQLNLVPALDSGWTDILDLDSTILIDVRYATMNNFVGEKMYPCARCILRPEVARALTEVHRKLQLEGLGLKLYDCYRPRSVQQRLWAKVPDARYVTPPEKGSMHNRGGAVDLTIIDLDGQELDMGTPYDFFGVEAYHTYKGHSDAIITNRERLRTFMSEAGFGHIRTEWWHYSYQRKTFELSDYQWPCPENTQKD